ncbi:MAG: hypothetical protein PHD76_05320 [Methylacidiphilales bacterium]|nr:hypothetical protein [Candidatus Methylacidiphilales bacterium]
MSQASRYLAGPWEMTHAGFIGAISDHLSKGYRVFEKPIKSPPPNQQFYQANVRLDPASENEDDDVYVEIRLENNRVVIICDAHNHTTGTRLPK